MTFSYSLESLIWFPCKRTTSNTSTVRWIDSRDESRVSRKLRCDLVRWHSQRSPKIRLLNFVLFLCLQVLNVFHPFFFSFVQDAFFFTFNLCCDCTYDVKSCPCNRTFGVARFRQPAAECRRGRRKDWQDHAWPLWTPSWWVRRGRNCSSNPR